MKIKEEMSFGIFPMDIICKRVEDEYGFAYGDKNDFCCSKLEIEAEDIVAHDWSKYPDYKGTDYGVKCPKCGQFIVINKNILPKSIKDAAPKVQLK